jgi:hypothetical protein
VGSLLIGVLIATYLSLLEDSWVSGTLTPAAPFIGKEAITQRLSPLESSPLAATMLSSRLTEATQEVEYDMDAIVRVHGADKWAKLYKSVHTMNDTRLLDKVKRAILTGGGFTIGVQGTSVSAGHDNYFHQVGMR